MNRESFLETIKQQYAEEIHEAYIEHEHGLGGKVDYPGLNKHLKKLMNSAKVEGLKPQEFEELAQATLPEEVARQIDLGGAPVKKAA
jgi:hypothetical protein